MKKSHQSACRFKKKPYLCTRLRKMPILRSTYNRDVAQLVSVHVWGACGRQFESGHPDIAKEERYFSECRSLLFPKVLTTVIILKHISAGINVPPTLLATKETTSSSNDYGRQDDPRTTQQVHEQDKVEKHSARDDCAPVLVQPWFSLPHTCSSSSWHSRHRHHPSAHLHLHQRMLLAWT